MNLIAAPGLLSRSGTRFIVCARTNAGAAEYEMEGVR
jgi:hypothetical protein